VRTFNFIISLISYLLTLYEGKNFKRAKSMMEIKKITAQKHPWWHAIHFYSQTVIKSCVVEIFASRSEWIA
jgi:hypothetical protein